VGKVEKCTQIFWCENLNGLYHLRVLAIDERIILKWLFGCDAVDWINVTQDRNHCLDFVVMFMNFSFFGRGGQLGDCWLLKMDFGPAG
jgi:hypothetical protein